MSHASVTQWAPAYQHLNGVEWLGCSCLRCEQEGYSLHEGIPSPGDGLPGPGIIEQGRQRLGILGELARPIHQKVLLGVCGRGERVAAVGGAKVDACIVSGLLSELMLLCPAAKASSLAASKHC